MHTPRSSKKPDGPLMPWMTGDFASVQSIRHHFPTPFLLLCKLVNISPGQLLADFADNLGHGSWKRSGRDAAKTLLRAYFITHGYGGEIFTEEELTELFGDLDAVGRLFPSHDATMAEVYGQWRDAQYRSWFHEWYSHRGSRRNLREQAGGN